MTTAVHNRAGLRGGLPRDGIYIGRPSKWGNPFQIGILPGERRADVIRKYEEWIKTQPQLLAQIGELRDKKLYCWCAPQACHGDVLARLADGGLTPAP